MKNRKRLGNFIVCSFGSRHSSGHCYGSGDVTPGQGTLACCLLVGLYPAPAGVYQLTKISDKTNMMGSIELVSKMPSECAAPNCREYTGKENPLSFHSFPKDQRVCQQWLQKLKRDEFDSKGRLKPWKPNKHSVLCSKHFLLEDFTLKTQLFMKGSIDLGPNNQVKHGYKKELKPDAVPSIFPPPEDMTGDKRPRQDDTEETEMSDRSKRMRRKKRKQVRLNIEKNIYRKVSNQWQNNIYLLNIHFSLCGYMWVQKNVLFEWEGKW